MICLGGEERRKMDRSSQAGRCVVRFGLGGQEEGEEEEGGGGRRTVGDWWIWNNLEEKRRQLSHTNDPILHVMSEFFIIMFCSFPAILNFTKEGTTVTPGAPAGGISNLSSVPAGAPSSALDCSLKRRWSCTLKMTFPKAVKWTSTLRNKPEKRNCAGRRSYKVAV